MSYKIILFVVILALTSSCKIVRSIGETIGIVDEKPKQEQVYPTQPIDGVEITDETSKVNLGKWLFWSVLLLGAAILVRYKVLKRDNEN